MEQPKNRNVFFVGLLSFFGGISQDVFAPILPLYLTTVLGFDKTFVGIAEGIVTAGQNVFAVVAGYFSDKFKRQKPIIFIGYFLSMISRPLLALVTPAAAVLGLRALDGVGKGLKDPAKDVLIAGSAEQSVRGRSFGIARMLDTLGSVAGPLILFGLLYLLQNSTSLYHWILLLSAVPLVFTLLITTKKLREVSHPAPPAPVAGRHGLLPRSFYLFLGIVLLFTLGNSSDAFLILRARSIGVTLLEIPLVIALFNLIYASFAVPLGSLSDRIGRIPTMLIGWLMYTLVYVGFAFTTHAATIWVLYGLYGIYFAANLGVAKAFLADIVGPDWRGRAFGIYGTTVGVATLLASVIAGVLWDRFGPQVPFLFGAGMSLLASLCLLVCFRKLRVAA
jgi:MFS family permease